MSSSVVPHKKSGFISPKYWMILTLLFSYKFIRMNMLGTCRFYPSCSNYSLQAFGRHDFFKAVSLMVRRILKCHPFTPGGYDPVPEPINCHCETAV